MRRAERSVLSPATRSMVPSTMRLARSRPLPAAWRRRPLRRRTPGGVDSRPLAFFLLPLPNLGDALRVRDLERLRDARCSRSLEPSLAAAAARCALDTLKVLFLVG